MHGSCTTWAWRPSLQASCSWAWHNSSSVVPANEHVTKLVMAALAKGAVMASFLVAMDVEFVKALAIAIVSACLSGFFLIVSSIYTVRHTRELTGKLEDVKRKLGASKRSADEGEERL